MHEVTSTVSGIPGLFYFKKAALMPQPPKGGEFVKWFAANVTDFELFDFSQLEELGDFSSIEENNDRAGFCRFFNQVDIEGDVVKKIVVDPPTKKCTTTKCAGTRKPSAWDSAACPRSFPRHHS